MSRGCDEFFTRPGIERDRPGFEGWRRFAWRRTGAPLRVSGAIYKPRRMLKGIGLKIGATFAFALTSALIKASAPVFPVSEVVFFRSIFAMLTLAAWLASRGEWPAALRTTRPLGHVRRSIAGSCGMFSNFVALSLLPLADATAFTFATPLMVVPLASIVLGEEVRLTRALAVATGFVGVLVMLTGHLGQGAAVATSRIGAIVALFGAGSAAVAMIQTRRLTRSEATGAIVFYFSSVTTVISLAFSSPPPFGRRADLSPAPSRASASSRRARSSSPGLLRSDCSAAVGRS
jgi:drug/metabolite transporter (DMT)-like permease